MKKSVPSPFSGLQISVCLENVCVVSYKLCKCKVLTLSVQPSLNVEFDFCLLSQREESALINLGVTGLGGGRFSVEITEDNTFKY